MPYDYNALYKTTPNALGEPTKLIVEFFDKFEGRLLRVLDVGCGQGRDALFIARLGHDVVGVDTAESGIRDLNETARRENLNIEGHVADITTFAPDGAFDIVLIDRTLHMLPKPERLLSLERLLNHVADEGHVLIADERSNIPDMKKVIAAHNNDWRTSFEKNGYLFIQRA